jgi:hypothetical protein
MGFFTSDTDGNRLQAVRLRAPLLLGALLVCTTPLWACGDGSDRGDEFVEEMKDEAEDAKEEIQDEIDDHS